MRHTDRRQTPRGGGIIKPANPGSPGKMAVKQSQRKCGTTAFLKKDSSVH